MKTETADALLKVIRDSREQHPVLAEQAGPLNEAQALRDCAGILERLPRAIAWARRPGQGRGDRTHKGELRILAEVAAEDFYQHTGKDFGSTTNDENRRKGGLFPKFIALLATEYGMPFERKTLYGACREAKRALTEKYYALHPGEKMEIVPRIGKHVASETDTQEQMDADLRRRNDAISRREHAIRKLPAKRATLLRPHAVGYFDEDGNEVADDRPKLPPSVAEAERHGEAPGWPAMEGYEPAPNRSEPASKVFAKAIRKARGTSPKSC